MKITLCVLFLAVTLSACKPEKLEQSYASRTLSLNDDFDGPAKTKEDVLSIAGIDSGRTKRSEQVMVKFKDTTIAIQDDQKPKADKFLQARFLNTQKTTVLVQLSNYTTPQFYVIYLQNGKPEVVSLNKPSNGKADEDYTNGIEDLSGTIFLVNNDFLINRVNAKVYPIKRQNPDERIQGKFYMNSADRTTLVFLTPSSLYQTNYLTGEVFNQPIPAKMASQPESITGQIQQNYSWQKNANGTSFLRPNADDDRIVDIKEFKH